MKGGKSMPIVRVDWYEGRTDQQKKELVESITNIVSEIGKVDKSRVIIFINDYPGNCVGIDGRLKINA
jgi:4-oxalocrotonate tautomerase